MTDHPLLRLISRARILGGGFLLVGAVSACTVTNGGVKSAYKQTYSNVEDLQEAYPQLETKRAQPSSTNFQPPSYLPESKPTGSPFLKAHLKNGEVLVFPGEWWLDEERAMTRGKAFVYGVNRRLKGSTDSVAWKDVALYETNRPLSSGHSMRMGAMTLLLVADATLGIICFTVEKACFGSCPTFYLDSASTDVRTADAEGFSNALMPSMAYTDLDYLGTRSTKGGTVDLTVKNEAMETHVIQGLELWAVPLNENEDAVHGTDGKLYVRRSTLPLIQAQGQEGDLEEILNARDGKERWHPASEKDLAQKEEIYLDFEAPAPGSSLGLSLDFRQSFVTTFLMYSAIGYMGSDYGRFLARAESSSKALNPMTFESGLGKALGGIEVSVWNEDRGDWQRVDRFHETGPIAINAQTMPLPEVPYGSRLRVRLRMTQGLWRLDRAAVSVLDRSVEPVRLSPIASTTSALPTAAPGSAAARVNVPGTEYVQTFEGSLPDGKTALFLNATGYYLEWSRQSWLSSRDLKKLARMVYQPESYLREVAPEFKAIEQAMEEVFWSTKQYTNPLNVTHEQ